MSKFRLTKSSELVIFSALFENSPQVQLFGYNFSREQLGKFVDDDYERLRKEKYSMAIFDIFIRKSLLC